MNSAGKERLICVGGPAHGQYLEIERSADTVMVELPLTTSGSWDDPDSLVFTQERPVAYRRREVRARAFALDPHDERGWLRGHALVRVGDEPDTGRLRDALGSVGLVAYLRGARP